MKCEIKKKSTQINKNDRQTGGGKRTVSELNSIEEVVIRMLGDVPISGDPNTNESAVSFSFTSNSPR